MAKKQEQRYQATIPDTLDLADRAELAINAMTGALDASELRANELNQWPVYQGEHYRKGRVVRAGRKCAVAAGAKLGEIWQANARLV